MGGVTPGDRGIGGGLVLPDEVDEGEAALADLAEDAEAAVVDPDVAAARGRVVQRVEPRHGAAHLRFPSSSGAHRRRSPMWLVRWVWVRKSAASARTDSKAPPSYVSDGQCAFSSFTNALFRPSLVFHLKNFIHPIESLDTEH